MSEQLLKEILSEIKSVNQRIDRIEIDVSQVETSIKDDMKSLFEIAGEHEVKIRTLTRRPV